MGQAMSLLLRLLQDRTRMPIPLLLQSNFSSSNPAGLAANSPRGLGPVANYYIFTIAVGTQIDPPTLHLVSAVIGNPLRSICQYGNAELPLWQGEAAGGGC